MLYKKIVQDIVPAKKRSIRNIPFTESVINKNPLSVKKSIERQDKKGGKGKISNIFITFIIIFVCIAIIAVAISLFYSKAVVTITPKIIHLQVDGTFTGKKDPKAGELQYEVMTSNYQLSKVVPSTDGPLIQTKAKGIVVLYNDYSTTTQKIIAGTRLSNSKGLIYRTLSSINIPGKKIVSGKIVPGNIEIGIVADQAGENYNLKLSDLLGDFKIIAYKGTAKYDGFYGRLKTDLNGGFSGNKKIISQEVEKSAITELESSIKNKLISQLKTTLPPGYVLYDNGYSIDYDVLNTSSKEANFADITIKGNIYSIMFDSQKLIEFIAGKETRKFPSASYNIKGISDLNFKIMNTKDVSLKKGTSVTFTLKGPLSIIGSFSEMSLKNELKGLNLSMSNSVFIKYPSISNADVLLTPFWMRSFPKSTENIILEYKNE